MHLLRFTLPLLALTCLVALPATSAPESVTVDFSVTLRDLAERARDDSAWATNDGPSPFQETVVVDGYVASVTPIRPSSEGDEEYRVELEVASGEWRELERVDLYRIIVTAAGERFQELVPERPPRDPEPHVVVPGRRVLVLGDVVGRREVGNEAIAVVEAHDMRRIR